MVGIVDKKVPLPQIRGTFDATKASEVVRSLFCLALLLSLADVMVNHVNVLIDEWMVLSHKRRQIGDKEMSTCVLHLWLARNIIYAPPGCN